MVNVGFHSARWLGARQRRRFQRLLRRPGALASFQARYNPTRLPCRLITFSGQRDLPEQVASLLSLFLHGGQPDELIVGSDGSHDAASIALLRQLHPQLEVLPWSELAPAPLPEPLPRHASLHPLGKKLALLLGQSALARRQRPLLYADSDILFFPAAAAEFPAWLEPRPGLSGRFLLDCQPALDERLLGPGDATDIPLNSGLLLLHDPPDWQLAQTRLRQLWHDAPEAAAGHYTEQTAVHLALPVPSYRPLPHHSCVVNILDQFRHEDLFLLEPRLVLRHYVNIVRYKFWRAVPAVLG